MKPDREPWFSWHWQNLTESDDVQNVAWERAESVRRRAEREGQSTPMVPPRRRRFSWHGRAWWHFGRREASVEWCIGKASRSCGVEIRASGFSVRVPWVLSLYVRMPFWFWRWHPLEVSIHSGALWWNLCTPEMEWSSKTPKWRHGSVHPLDLLFGSMRHSAVTLRECDVLIPMPEGAYPGKAKVELCAWTRKRWPWWPLKREMQSVNIKCDIGIPHEGKGENSWDCGEDATYSISRPARSVEEAVGGYVASVLQDRARYGGSNYPHPSERAKAIAERRAKAEAERTSAQTLEGQA